MSDGSQAQLAYVAEATRGTTPATPAFQKIGFKSETLELARSTLKSEKLRPDRQVTGTRLGTKEVTGGFDTGGLTYGEYDPFFEGVLGGAFTADVLKNGVTRKSFTLEKYFSDQASADNPYHRYTGVEFGGFDLDVKANAEVGCTFTALGKDMATAGAIVTGATYAALADVEPMDSFTGTVTEGGAVIAVVTEVQLKVDNGLKSNFVVGAKTGITPEIGMCNVTGQIVAFFEDDTLLSKFLNETASTLQFVVADKAGNTYTFDLPDLLYTKGSAPVSGPGAISVTLPFQGQYDATAGTTLKITRAAA